MNRKDAKSAEQAKVVGTTEPDAALNQLSNRVIGAAIEVHRHLGPGYLEALYEQGLCTELALQNIPFRRQVPIAVRYKGYRLGEGRLDLLVAEQLVVELKAVDTLAAIHTVQLRSYLKATSLSLGLLINFNVPVLRAGLKRVINST